jgi:Ca2+/H+ antiporter
MAHLVVPALATQRLTGSSARRRVLLLQGCLIVAVLLRVVPLFLPGLDGRVRESLLGAAGVVAWLALLLFAAVLWRARRQQAELIELTVQGARPGAGSTP